MYGVFAHQGQSLNSLIATEEMEQGPQIVFNGWPVCQYQHREDMHSCHVAGGGGASPKAPSLQKSSPGPIIGVLYS